MTAVVALYVVMAAILVMVGSGVVAIGMLVVGVVRTLTATIRKGGSRS